MTIISIENWLPTFNSSGYMLCGLSGLARIDEGSLCKYLYYGRVPRKANLEKMEKAMFQASQKPRIQYHPAYGYATEDQIKRLKEIGVGMERGQIMKEIEKQTASKGKYL